MGTMRILFVDDDESMCELVGMRLADRGIEAVWRTSPNEALELLEVESFDVVVTDLNMTEMNGLQLCERVVANRDEIPVIVVTAHSRLENAVAALRAHACDFLAKPIDIDALVAASERAAKRPALKREVGRLEHAHDSPTCFDALSGTSPPMARLFELLGRVADLDTSVLISGESGSGKELVARALHRQGRRKNGPFISINCAAVPETLLESELFGHVKGAFTDASTDRAGLFQQAHRGTLFLDEIGELPLRLQPKLLRILQERCVRPIGGDREVACDVRIVAATNRDLEAAIVAGQFRQDLLYRLNVIHVEVPPLRARGHDILDYAQLFVAQFAAATRKPVIGLSAAVAEQLLAYDWPGNTRELQNCIERAVALTTHDRLGVEDLPGRIRDHQRSPEVVTNADPTQLLPLEQVERRHIERVLEAAGGNKTRAAKILRVNRRTLTRKFGTR